MAEHRTRIQHQVEILKRQLIKRQKQSGTLALAESLDQPQQVLTVTKSLQKLPNQQNLEENQPEQIQSQRKRNLFNSQSANKINKNRYPIAPNLNDFQSQRAINPANSTSNEPLLTTRQQTANSQQKALKPSVPTMPSGLLIPGKQTNKFFSHRAQNRNTSIRYESTFEQKNCQINEPEQQLTNQSSGKVFQALQQVPQIQQEKPARQQSIENVLSKSVTSNRKQQFQIKTILKKEVQIQAEDGQPHAVNLKQKYHHVQKQGTAAIQRGSQCRCICTCQHNTTMPTTLQDRSRGPRHPYGSLISIDYGRLDLDTEIQQTNVEQLHYMSVKLEQLKKRVPMMVELQIYEQDQDFESSLIL